MANKNKKLVASIKQTAILTIDVKNLDKRRALCSLLTIEGMYKTDYFILRDMVEKEHDAFVYYTGETAYSHEFKNGIVTIYEEKYTLMQTLNT